MLALDNPVYSALTGDQAAFALGHGDALRYPPEVAPFAALREHTPAAFADLRELSRLARRSRCSRPRRWSCPKTGWDPVGSRWIDQMVCAAPPPEAGRRPRSSSSAPADVPEMLALTELTQPGPFGPRTIELRPLRRHARRRAAGRDGR